MNLKTIPQVARELNVSPDTVKRKAEAKGLLTVKIGKAWALTPGEVMILRRAVKGAGNEPPTTRHARSIHA